MVAPVSNGSSEPGGGGVQSVDRAVSVLLEILARLGEAGVTDLATDIGVHKSTVSRLLTALEEHELVEQAHERGKYRLGFGILRLANAVSGQLDITQQGREICERLAIEVGETVNIAVLRSHYVVNVDQARGPTSVGSHNWVGELTPLHADVQRQNPAGVHVRRRHDGTCGRKPALPATPSTPSPRSTISTVSSSRSRATASSSRPRN